MSCARARQLLDAWIDDELDPATRAEIGAHIDQCPGCAASRDERRALREAIRAAAPREAVPPAFAERLRQRLAEEHRVLDRKRHGPSWWQALGLALATGAVTAVAMLAFVPAAPALGDGAVLTAHVTSMSRAGGDAAKLLQVPTDDRHAVRPWFQGKIDFAPPVPDLSAQGFELLGARLDRLESRTAAVIVYRIRKHPIELYVTRSDAVAATPLRLASQRGYALASWSADGLAYSAISDVDPADLARFARALQ